jgi:GH24 family phage-related lysozyme (muramidase)
MADRKIYVNVKEAVNLPPPPIHFDIKQPPAIVSYQQYHNSQFQLTSDFINYIKSVENGIKAGFKHGNWYPHKSVEGGTDTIAYGHKLHPGDNYSRGITDAQATELLKKDIMSAAKRAEQIINFKFGKGAWERLDNTKKEMLIDFAFNGVLAKFPRFLNGVVTGDDNEVKTQYIRYVNGQEMTGRNQAFAKRYLSN